MSTPASTRVSDEQESPWGPLRAWQREALERYLAAKPRDFLAVATPGAGKTTFALTVAAHLLARRVVERVIVVTPTEHLKRQWAEAAHRGGIALDPTFSGRKGRTSRDFDGVAVTYAGVAASTLALRVRCERFKTFVILDEIHHAGDSLTWGEAVREAFEPATRRLCLTGTPFRSDANPIPFVTYVEDEEGVPRSAADYSYGYGEALADGVVRPVLFLAYSGDMRWRTSAGEEVAARLGEPLSKDMIAQAWRTALDPSGDWIPAVLRAADTRLTEVRRDVPDAGGLVIATDQESARAYAKILRQISGERPTLVLSDEPSASKRIATFAADKSRWMVAVKMVSEGVDVPRLAVGVYATATQTPLFFAQAVGRFVRARRRGETASLFLPTIPVLLRYAAEMEVVRDHALRKPVSAEDPFAPEDALLARAERTESTPDMPEQRFQALESEATFDRVVFDGNEFGGELGEDEREFLGIPGLLEPHQVAELLRRRRQATAQEAARKRTTATPETPVVTPGRTEERSADDTATYQRLGVLRRELNSLVAAWHHRTGQPHAAIHAELRRVCGGPPAIQASAEQLQARIDTIRAWATARR
ncbi:superfamily II DNA or RNA helicase [Thermasporomyces composti]|uniref:Superfamily II DNA or RNA helicase n=1 Tax=Thermasporomyces composti TaxID=696763 RepID=A0A3D9VEQ2_THECX|nr:superfamily II DNA or RNA helicase [Thermasporomyces composti]